MELADAAADCFDLHEVGLLHDVETEIDKEWRNETRKRPQRRRPRSEEGKEKYKELEELYEEGNESFDTSSH